MNRLLSYIHFIFFRLSEKPVMVSLSNHENVVDTICFDKLSMTFISTWRLFRQPETTYERGLIYDLNDNSKK